MNNRIVVWDGTLPPRCAICGVSLGKSLQSLVVHCMRDHEGKLEAIFNRGAEEEAKK